MKNKYQIEITEIKGKLDFGKNPWYIEIFSTIFSIPLMILGGLLWLLANGFYYIIVKPFKKEKAWNDLKWSEIAGLDSLILEKSEPINMFLDKKEQEWYDEDSVYAIRTKFG